MNPNGEQFRDLHAAVKPHNPMTDNPSSRKSSPCANATATADGDGVRAVARALAVLAAFQPGERALSVAELLGRVNLSRPTLYRLLYTLQAEGFLVGEGEPQRFRLGPAVGRLAHCWSAGADLAALAQPGLRRLWDETGETVALFAVEGVQRCCIAEIPSAQPLSFRRGVGWREKLVRGASGRVVLAHAVRTAADLAPFAEGEKLDVAAFLTELARVRKRGWAVSRDELIQGAVAVAAPVLGADGQARASLAVFGPSARLDDKAVQRLAKAVAAEAAALSQALGAV